MEPLWPEACGGDGSEGFFETVALRDGARGEGYFGFGEVGENAFEVKEGLAFEPVEECLEVFPRGDALTGHARVNF